MHAGDGSYKCCYACCVLGHGVHSKRRLAISVEYDIKYADGIENANE